MPIGWGWLCRWSGPESYLFIQLLQQLVCTLAFAWQVFDDAPLVVAANRDEANGRPATPPGRYLDEPAAIAPRDETAGGTWIGYNEHGVFVGITNRWVDREGDRSRGQLVADCLGAESATAALESIKQATETDRYAGFNLVVVDRTRAVLIEFDGRLSVTDVAPGVHVVVNVGADGEYFEPPNRPAVGRTQAANADQLRVALESTTGESASTWLDRAADALGDHHYGVCIHGDDFGTRSASLIRLEWPDDESSKLVDHYWFADGPPCHSEFRRVESRL